MYTYNLDFDNMHNLILLESIISIDRLWKFDKNVKVYITDD